ncbi:hypothetical protein V2J09_003528 [Rumex salicifolius]
MANASSYKNEMNLKATELRLALPGSDEPEQPTSSVTSKKRSSLDLDNNQTEEWIPPPSKAQVVGWPPIQSFRRKNSIIEAKKSGNGSGLFVKVNKDGAPYLRKIDLKAYQSYGELLRALECMFKVRIGEYSERQGYGDSDYVPSYEDKDGDWMLVGDVPWEMFVLSCKRLRIMNTSEAKGRFCI